MEQYTEAFVGIDTAKNKHALAIADPGRDGEIRYLGEIDIVWCKDCQHQVEPDPPEMAQRYGAATTVLDWSARLVCSKCSSREIDMVVTGTERRS